MLACHCPQGKPLQTNLLTGMESYLGVRQPSDKWRGTESPEADKATLAQSKTIFEMLDIESVSTPNSQPRSINPSNVPRLCADCPMLPAFYPPSQGDAPVLLPLVKRAAAASGKQAQRSATQKPSTTVVSATRPGRAGTTVVDLSGTPEGNKLAGTYDPKKTKRGNRRRASA